MPMYMLTGMRTFTSAYELGCTGYGCESTVFNTLGEDGRIIQCLLSRQKIKEKQKHSTGKTLHSRENSMSISCNKLRYII